MRRMDALNVLHVTPYYDDAWAYGGIPRAVTALTRALARRGHRVTVATTDAGTATTRASTPDGTLRDDVRRRVFPNVSNIVAYRLQLFTPLGLGRYLARHARDFDVVHLHACHNLPGVIAARQLARGGIPWVLSPHGTAGFIERRRLAKRVFDAALGRRVLRDAAAVTALTAVEHRELTARGVASARIHVVPAPIDLEDVDAASAPGAFRAHHALGPGPLVTFLGTLTPRKRLDVLAAAFAQLGIAGARLVIAGNDMGSGHHARRAVDTLGLASRTRFTGLLTGRGRFAALADADVVACPAAHESFGLVAVEALLAGTPVVVADDSGCAEIIRSVGGGLVVRAGDAGALAAALRAILDDLAGWRAAARSAASVVRERYGSDRVAGETELVYRFVLGARRAAMAFA